MKIFKILAEDFTCSPEEVDEDEVNSYLEILKENNETSNNDFIDNYLGFVKDKFQYSTEDINNLLLEACKSENIQLVEYIISNKSIDINSKVILIKKN